ncbi:hypothetical protein [Desulfocurvibacter africanus]|uniref:hypothetical protein n=1 Tax=Desulfocurvibacter africanus TaxID=873 RepID=UPI000416A9AC|nr:hypothetical protein [Desulfocurvibacter africanus]
MITEKFNAALNDLGSLAGTVPSDIWERLSPIHAQLRGIQEPLSNLEALGIMSTMEDGERLHVACPENGVKPGQSVPLSECLVCGQLNDCFRA